MNNQPMKRTIYVLMLLMFTLASCEKGNGPEIGGILITKGYADLGLSVKWASCNVGATTPEGYGNYYNFDAAQAYSLPTKAQMQELIDNCFWVCAKLNGINGIKATGPNGNSIFMPCAGYRYDGSHHYYGYNGYSWSSVPYSDYDYLAYYLFFDDGGGEICARHYSNRLNEYSVRTVSEK